MGRSAGMISRSTSSSSNSSGHIPFTNSSWATEERLANKGLLWALFGDEQDCALHRVSYRVAKIAISDSYVTLEAVEPHTRLLYRSYTLALRTRPLVSTTRILDLARPLEVSAVGLLVVARPLGAHAAVELTALVRAGLAHLPSPSSS